MNLIARTASEGPQLRTILLTDLVDSTSLVERLGDIPASELFREHDRLVLKLQEQWRGRLIDRSDGLLLLFERPIDGLGFALDYARGLHDMGKARGYPLQARAGLHVGEVLTWKNSEAAVSVGAKPLEVEGLAKPMAARMMTLARPGQILLSAMAEPLARRAARELGERGEHLLWKSYGRWRFKGIPEPHEIFEVGEVGIAPLRAPSNMPKAWRDIPLWRRPAALAAEVVLLVGLGVGVWFVTKPQPAIAFSERDWVVVGDVRNLTGESRYDDTLATALRISLEQSRYVNVMPAARVQDTLKMMGRNVATQVDRRVGSEVAQRSGARALLLPTISETGGQVHVNIEVVDPLTETTVFTESAAGKGADSVVNSVGEAGEALRGMFGEEMASIQSSSAPLEKVTTNSLDALRAFTLGQKAYAQQNLDAAEQQFKQALDVDPNFAMARIGLARVAYSKTDVVTAQQQMKLAVADVSRLTDRERLYALAQVAQMRWDKDFIDRWQALSRLYPDFHIAAFNAAGGMRYGNRYAEMREYSDRAAAMQAITRPVALAYRAIAESAVGQSAQAQRDFREAQSLGYRAGAVEHAMSLAGASKFADAEKLLLEQSRGEPTYAAVERILAGIHVAADAGRSEEAIDKARKLAASLPNPAFPFDWAARSTAIAIIKPVATRAELARETKRLVDQGEQALPAARGRAREAVAAAVLYAGYVAAEQGDAALAKRALAIATPVAQQAPQPILDNFAGIVRARIALHAGDADAALEELNRYNQPWALSLTEVERIRVRQALGQAQQAETKALATPRWRGRAYAEWGAERPPLIESLRSP